MGLFEHREDAIGIAQIYVQRWHGYDSIAHGHTSVIRVYDTEEKRVVAIEEGCKIYRAVKLAQHGIALKGER